MIDNQVQSTFIWSQSIESLASIELIYHIDSLKLKQFILPVHIKFKHSQTLIELLTINTYLQFDVNRDFYSINIDQYFIQIKFEDLGLAYLIIRPREYTFTYCDGTCSYSTLQQQQHQSSSSSMHALFRSIVNRKNPNIPQPTCVPSQFADDNFLLRQMDGTMEIYPIKDVIVKQCTCL